MKRSLLALSLLPALCTQAADEAALRYSLNGVDGALRDNVRAYLGPLPDTEYERDNLLYSARRDVERALNAMGYYQAEIDLDLDQSTTPWTLSIDIQPGQPVTLDEMDIVISGEARQDESFSTLLESSPLQAGDVLNHEAYEDFKAELQTLGNTRGYFAGDLTENRVTVDLATQLASVSLHYDSGDRFHFGQVSIDDFPLDPVRIEQLMPFREGDPFDVELLQDFQSDLQRTGYFGSALVQPLAPDPDSRTVPLQVQLQPGDRNHYRVGLGYSTDTRERISLTWRTPLLNRHGHWQESRIEYSPVRPRLNFTYVIPLSHPLDDQLRLGIRLENNEYGSLDSWQYESSVRRDWKPHWKPLNGWISSARLRYLIEDWELYPRKLNNDYLLPGFSLSKSTSKGNPLDPSRGFSQLYLVEGGADQAGSDMDLLRLYANLRGVYALSDQHRLVGRAELGSVHFSRRDRPDLAPSLSFFAGGTYSIRGYAYQSLGPTERVELPDGTTRKLVVGGDRLAILSGEYQYYVTPEWRAAVFVDAGNAYNAGNFDPVVGAGIGVHFVSPVGAIRIDLANPVSENAGNWRVHIALGAEF